MDIFLKDFNDYIERMNEIRLLSTPDLDEIDDSEEYGRTLVMNFSRIGSLASTNRAIIDQYVKPYLSGEKCLGEKDRAILEKFNELLMEKWTFEEIDAHLSEALSDLLIDDIEEKRGDSEDDRVVAMAGKVKRDYYLISELTRFISDDTEIVRQKAIENHTILSVYLEKDAFIRLGDEAKSAVLQFSILGALLYENTLEKKPKEYWIPCLNILKKGEEILNDPFYRETLPGYDWETYSFRIKYYGSLLAYSILPHSIAMQVYEYAKASLEYLKTCKKEATLAAVNIEQEEDLMYLASVQAGIVSAREACDAFYAAYKSRDKNDYSVIGANKNLDTPSSYLCMAKTMDLKLNEEDHDRFYEIQNSMLDYLYHIPNRCDVYLKCMTLFTNLPIYFQEVPGAMTMEEFCISAFAAVHPPTYVHVNMVARLAECMARHLLDMNPELFRSFPGCYNGDSVLRNKRKIIDYTYHAALCHDIGKLFIIDTISMYGRSLLDSEFSTIKKHPAIGAKLASEHSSTRDYVDVIKGHHLWYDCSRGYPDNFDTRKSPYKTIIDIILAADCLDAATDTVGRSYSKGKVFSDFEKEVIEGAGTHYAPFLVDLFKQPELREDIDYLLNEGRNKLYRETFRLLKRRER